jgi:hypothetical protein
MTCLGNAVYIKGRQVSKVAISIWAGVSPGTQRIIVPTGSQTGYLFTTFFAETAIRILVDMKPM